MIATLERMSEGYNLDQIVSGLTWLENVKSILQGKVSKLNSNGNTDGLTFSVDQPVITVITVSEVIGGICCNHNRILKLLSNCNMNSFKQNVSTRRSSSAIRMIQKERGLVHIGVRWLLNNLSILLQ